jgi:hypothetical protein
VLFSCGYFDISFVSVCTKLFKQWQLYYWCGDVRGIISEAIAELIVSKKCRSSDVFPSLPLTARIRQSDSKKLGISSPWEEREAIKCQTLLAYTIHKTHAEFAMPWYTPQRAYKNTGRKHLRARGATTSPHIRNGSCVWDDDELVMVPRYEIYHIQSMVYIKPRENNTHIIERQEHTHTHRTPLRVCECREVVMNDIWNLYTEYACMSS